MSWQAYLDEHEGQFLEELLDFLRIPSVSALPDHAADVARAGEWVAARLRAAGLEGVRVLPTGGHPVVYGEWLHAAGKPTVLIYGHFDAQPADPLRAVDEPAVRAGRCATASSMRAAPPTTRAICSRRSWRSRRC